jgi:flagellar hook-associated protein 1
MSNLTAAMSIAIGALLADQAALQTTSNNIANANTPGYSRQRAILAEADPVVLGEFTFGNGVMLEKIESLRDSILEMRLHGETQQQSQLDAVVSAMQQVESMFSGSAGDIGDQLSKLFNSIQELSTDPASPSRRQGVLTAANNLANAFRTVASNLQQQRNNLDLSVSQAVQQGNVVTKQIAKLNGQITAMQNLHQDTSSFEDQRTVLIRQLSGLIDLSVIRSDDNGLTLTTASGTALVAGDRSFDLQTQMVASGVLHIFSQSSDITATLSGGQLAGLLAVRDQKIPALLNDLDTLAAGLANALNTAHHSGFDLNGHSGVDLFAAPPASGRGAAASLAVAISDPALLAASSDGSPGSNGNLAVLSAVSDQAVVAGQTPTDFYANLVFKVGNQVSNGLAELNASDLILQQLQGQRGSISGVSLDEEAAHMIEYQHAFAAAARVVTTVSDMLDVAVNLGRY